MQGGIRKIGVIGAGQMGSGIAHVAAERRVPPVVGAADVEFGATAVAHVDAATVPPPVLAFDARGPAERAREPDAARP